MDLELLYRRAPGPLQTALFNAHAWRVEMHRYGYQFRNALEELIRQERSPRDTLRVLQDERVREVVGVAHSRTPYYRSLFDRCGIEAHEIRGIQDLPRIPLLSKETVRSHGKDLWAAKTPQSGWLHGHTSGTTGTPLSLWYDRHTCVMTNAVDQRQKLAGGMEVGDWIGVLLGRMIVSPERKRPPFWKTNYVQKQVWFSSFHMSPENLDHYVAEIRDRGLRFLEGYPSTLYILATHVLREGRKLPMRAVFTSSETLHEVQREKIREAFQCEVFDYYGLAERVIFAAECEAHEGKHLAEEYGYAEVVDGDGRPVPDGETGYLVGTSLLNTAMPLIRYRTSDVSAIIAKPCSCGRTSRRIRSVTTKAEDILVTPDGRYISPSVLTHPFKPFDQLVESQVVQETLRDVVIKLVPGERFTDDHRDRLVAGLRERLGPEMTIEVQVVDRIPRGPSGKLRWVVSKVEHDRRFDWQTERATQDPAMPVDSA